MKHTTRLFAIIFAAFIAASCSCSQNGNRVSAEDIALLDSLWQRRFNDAEGIIALHDSIARTTAQEKKGAQILNQCQHF